MLGTLLDVLACFVGLAVICAAPYVFRKSADTVSWIPISAKILRSKVVPTENGPAPEVWYRYVIEGREYECSNVRLHYLTSSFGRTRAAATVSRYPPTAQVLAYVNPGKHSEAVLEPGAQPEAALFLAAVGAMFLVIGGYRLLRTLGFIGT
jgi:Protein of unknown function (DUF3592)